MIDKEYHPKPSTDRFQKAGDAAEQQMAHYLRRAFGEDPEVHVFNNLRLEHNGEIAQIDHLIFHRTGFILVESKSVTSAVRINERGEWARQWNGDWKGMASPVLQAQRQADLLRALLQSHKVELRNKMLFGLKQGGFSGFLMDVVVAISDSGLIDYQGQLPDVKKADQVSDHLKALIKSHNRAANILNNDTHKGNVGVDLKPEEVTRICQFLLSQHQERSQSQKEKGEVTAAEPALPDETTIPQPVQAPTSAPDTSASALPEFKCSKCQSHHLQIQFGKSYYFKCLDCGGNTAIHLTCRQCHQPARTRKQGKEFYAECQNGHSERYFVNP